MTISNSQRSAGPFVGNDSAISFPFAFKVFQASDLVVVRTSGNSQKTLILQADYTVSLNKDQDAIPGGVVTLKAPLAFGASLVLTSAIAETQGTSLSNQGGFYPKVIEAALDRLTIMVQQLRTILGRTLRFPLSDTGANAELPIAAVRANTLLGFDGNGNPVPVGISLAPERPVQIETQIGVAGQTQFDLKTVTYTPGINSMHVYLDGFRLSLTDYTETGTTSITLKKPLTEQAELLFEAGSAVNSQSFADATLVSYAPRTGATTTVSAILRNLGANIDMSLLPRVVDPLSDNALMIVSDGAPRGVSVGVLRSEVGASAAGAAVLAATARDQAVAAAADAKLSSSTATYLTYAAMTADASKAANTQGRVTNDGDLTKNGYYVWNGASWVRATLQPASSADLAKYQNRISGSTDLVTESEQAQQLMVLRDNVADALVIMAGDRNYLAIDTSKGVLSTNLRIDAGVEARPEMVFVNVPPVFRRDTTVPAYARQSRLYQGTPSIERTAGGNYWVAWRADTATGHEGAGNFAVMGRMASPSAPLIEQGVFAFDDVNSFITDPMLWRAPDGCMWMFFGVSGKGDWDCVGGSWAVICQNPDAKFPVWGRPFRLSYYGDPRHPVMVNGKWHIAIDTWRYAAELPPRYLDKAGGAIYELDWKNQRVHFVSRLPPNNAGGYSGFFETEFFQRADGSVLATCRWTAGDSGVLWSVSTDMMQTWTPWQNYTVLAPASSSRIWLGRSPTGRVVCCWNNDTIRRTLTLALSEDDGATFPYRVLVEPNQNNGVSYPVVTFSDSGQILVAYDVERNILRQICVATIVEEDIVAGKAVPFINLVSAP